MIVISRCKINIGERHVTREVTLSAKNSMPSKNNFRGITMGIGPIWGVTSLTFILSWRDVFLGPPIFLSVLCFAFRNKNAPRDNP